MNANRFSSITAAAAAGLALAVAAPAMADTYCVHQGTGCQPGDVDRGADLAQALADAKAHPGADVVTIGPGTYAAPVSTGFFADGSGGLAVVGAGAGTVLEQPIATGTVLAAVGAEISNLTVQTPTSSGARGLQVSGGEIHGVTVTGGGTNTDGVYLAGGALLRDSVISMDEVASTNGVYATSFSGVAPTIRDTEIVARTGVYVSNGQAATTTVRRVRIRAKVGVYANASAVAVDTSAVEYVAGGQYALAAECSANGSSSLTVDGVTLVGPGSGTGIRTGCSTASFTATAVVRNTAIKGFAYSLRSSTLNGATADLSISYSAFEASKIDLAGTGTVTPGAGNIDTADPLFTAADDLRPAAGSPLIDAGDPAGSAQATDLAGNPRISGGRIDIGAYEFQYPAPAGGGGSGGGGGSSAPADGTGDVPPADATAASTQDTPAPVAAPSVTGAPVPALDRAAMRAALADAIAGTRGQTHRLRWPAAGTARFVWRAGGRVVARGNATRTSAGTAAVTVVRTKAGERLLRRDGVRVKVRATFAPQGAAPVAIKAKLARR